MVNSSLIQLFAKGPIDKVMYGNPQISFFKCVYKRPMNFATQYVYKNFNGNVDWGSTLSTKVPKEGDLLGGVYIRIKLGNLTRKTPYYSKGISAPDLDRLATYIGEINALRAELIATPPPDDTRRSAILVLIADINTSIEGLQPIVQKGIKPSGTIKIIHPTSVPQTASAEDYYLHYNTISDNPTLSDPNPTISFTAGTSASTTTEPQFTSYVNGIGSRIIEEVSIYSGSHLLERIPGEWLFIENELSNNNNSKEMFYDSIYYNNSDDGFKIGNPSDGGNNINDVDLLIPVPFFFTKDTGLHLPIMAMHNELEIKLKLRNIDECVVKRYQKGTSFKNINVDSDLLVAFTNASINIGSVVAATTLRDLIDIHYTSAAAESELKKNISALIMETIQNNFKGTNGVKGFIHSDNNDENGLPLDIVDNDEKFGEEVVSTIDKVDMIYKYFHIDESQKIQFLSRRNTYIVPLVHEISLSTFNYIENSFEHIPLELRNPVRYVVFVLQRKSNYDDGDYFNYTKEHTLKKISALEGESGVDASGIYTRPSISTNNMLDEFNFSVENIDILDSIPSKVLNNIEFFTKFRNSSNVLIYVYSFSLYPNEINPSGSLNFSQVKDQFIKLKLLSGLTDLSSEDILFRGYYSSYNIFTIDEGLAGFRFY